MVPSTYHERMKLRRLAHDFVSGKALQPLGNITGADNTLTIRHGAGQSTDLRLIVNARVECTPEHLDQLVREALLAVIQERFTEDVIAWRFLQPGRPNPTHRFTEVVA